MMSIIPSSATPSTLISDKTEIPNTQNRSASQQAFARAKQLMPGGVSSPVRAFKSVGGQPVFMQKAQGAYLWDVDNNPYIDFVGSWGPAIAGHAHPAVINRICQVAQNGTSFGTPGLLETELAELIIAAVPSIQKVRFVNSGTEAVMGAIRLARAFTGRDKLIKFAGCYHGHADALLVKAGSGATTLGTPDSPGVPQAVATETLTAKFNDLSSVQSLLEAYSGQVAGILVEPVAGNMGCIAPQPGFLAGLRKLADTHGTLLIFDEVMTGFRVAYGGAQALYGITPDITTLGKIMGGGLPAAAYGGRADIMAQVAPEGPMYQAGTLSGNPLAMAAGIETLKLLQAPGFYDRLEASSEELFNGLLQAAQRHGVVLQGNRVGSMLTLFFTAQPVVDYDSALLCDRERFGRFFNAMLDRGVYLPPSQFESWFVCSALSHQDVAQTLAAAEHAFSSLC